MWLTTRDCQLHLIQWKIRHQVINHLNPFFLLKRGFCYTHKKTGKDIGFGGGWWGIQELFFKKKRDATGFRLFKLNFGVKTARYFFFCCFLCIRTKVTSNRFYILWSGCCCCWIVQVRSLGEESSGTGAVSVAAVRRRSVLAVVVWRVGILGTGHDATAYTDATSTHCWKEQTKKTINKTHSPNILCTLCRVANSIQLISSLLFFFCCCCAFPSILP